MVSLPPKEWAGKGREMNIITAMPARHDADAFSGIHPAPAKATPLVVVVESTPRISESLRELCDFLRIRVVCVTAGAALARELLVEKPICVLAHAPQAGPEVCDALAAVARHDPALPVLLVTDNTLDTPAAGLGLDQADDLKPLSNLYWVAQRPGLRMLVEFLFMAERQGDVGGLMPV